MKTPSTTTYFYAAARLAIVTTLVGLGGCASQSPSLATAPLKAEQIAQIVAAPDRTPADRNNDLRRKPEPMLAFIGALPGMVALDLSTGGGYTAELLARAIGPTGMVFGQAAPRNPAARPPAAPEGNANPGAAPQATAATAPGTSPATSSAPAGNTVTLSPVPMLVTVATVPTGPRPPGVALAEREQRLRLAMAQVAPLVAVVQPFENPVPASLADVRIDLVTLMFNYHDLGHMGVDRAAMNRAVFKALKPGGIYVIADHAGRPGTGISEAGTLHRIDEAFLKSEVEAAGFKWVAAGDFLRNPNDPRDRNTPNPPQPKDEFVFKFVKP